MAVNDPPGSLKADDEDTGLVGGAARVGTLAEAPPAPETGPTLVPIPDDKARAAKKGPYKLSKREKKVIKDAHRNLDSWERYRALTDVLSEALDLVDLADHKARFALIIMGALNALLFIMASQTDAFDAIPASWRPVMTGAIAVYALIALYFVIQSIESLRPRKAQPQVRYAAETGLEDFPVGIRFYEDILSRDVEAYRRAWRELRIGQLNAELAVQAHALAQINKAKYNALRRLYTGLQLMTVMAVVLVGVGSYFVLSGKARRLDKAGKARGTELGTPRRFTNVGVREPSGVAFHPPSGHLFVIGDDGKLAELDTEGHVLRSQSLPGNLEDVAVHTPTGNLVVLTEQTSELILFDPVANKELKRWHLDKFALVGRSNPDPNQGFEGLGFRPDPSLPGGGMFYLTHQRAPARVVAIAFDPAGPAGELGAEVVKARFDLAYEDLTAITYVAELDRLLVVSDAADRLLVVKLDGGVEREIPLPGKQQEGIAVDPEGNIWVADDKDKSLLKIEGSLEALRSPPSHEGRGNGLHL